MYNSIFQSAELYLVCWSTCVFVYLSTYVFADFQYFKGSKGPTHSESCNRCSKDESAKYCLDIVHQKRGRGTVFVFVCVFVFVFAFVFVFLLLWWLDKTLSRHCAPVHEREARIERNWEKSEERGNKSEERGDERETSLCTVVKNTVDILTPAFNEHPWARQQLGIRLGVRWSDARSQKVAPGHLSSCHRPYFRGTQYGNVLIGCS